MSEPRIILPVPAKPVDKIELLKSHVNAYTRKDGVVVAAHDDSRVAKTPDWKSAHEHAEGLSAIANYKHTGHKEAAEALDHAASLHRVASKRQAPGDMTPSGHGDRADALESAASGHWDKAGGKPKDKDGGGYVKPAHVKSTHDDSRVLSKPEMHPSHSDGADRAVQHHVDLEGDGFERKSTEFHGGSIKNGYAAHYEHKDGRKATVSLHRSKDARGAWETDVDHDDKRAAANKPVAHAHRKIAEAATYSGGQYEEHSATHTDRHSSRSIRVPGADKNKAMDHARDAFSVAGMKRGSDDSVSGAERYKSDSHSAELSHNNGTVHVSVKKND